MKMLLAGLAAASAIAAVAPAADAQPYGHAYGHWGHEGWRDHDGWRPGPRMYGPRVGYYGPRYRRPFYGPRCHWRHGYRVCRGW